MGKVAVYPGTFDPITNGHLVILNRALSLFDEVVVAVATTARKQPFFNLEDRMHMLQAATADIAGIKIACCEGLLVDFVKQHAAHVVIRGLRAVSDFDYEFQLAGMNHMMAPDIETIFLPALGDDAYISSTMVREIVSLGGDPSQFVPSVVQQYLQKK